MHTKLISSFYHQGKLIFIDYFVRHILEEKTDDKWPTNIRTFFFQFIQISVTKLKPNFH